MNTSPHKLIVFTGLTSCLSHAALVLPETSSRDTIGESIRKVDVTEEQYQFSEPLFGFVPIDPFRADFTSFGIGVDEFGTGRPLGGLATFGALRNGSLFLFDVSAYEYASQFAFRSQEVSVIPSLVRGSTEPGAGVFFRFDGTHGFVEGNDNYTRFSTMRRIEPSPLIGLSGAEIRQRRDQDPWFDWEDEYPFWVQWDVELDDQGYGVSVSPIAAFGEEGVPLTPSQASLAIISVPEPGSSMQILMCLLGGVLFRSRKSSKS